MKAFIKSVVWVIVVVALVYFGGGQVLPDKARLEHHVVIAAAPEKIYPMFSTLRRFADWAPWCEATPKVAVKFDGPEQGTGQKMTWTSTDPATPSGSQAVTAVKDNIEVTSDLDISGKGKGTTTISLATTATGTGVTWTFEAPLSSVWQRWYALFAPPVVDDDIVKGLRRLKAMTEKPAS